MASMVAVASASCEAALMEVAGLGGAGGWLVGTELADCHVSSSPGEVTFTELYTKHGSQNIHKIETTDCSRTSTTAVQRSVVEIVISVIEHYAPQCLYRCATRSFAIFQNLLLRQLWLRYDCSP